MDDVRGGDVLAAGTRLEEFEVERELGAGGFGVTYLARDLSLERQVAIKEYLPHDWGARTAPRRRATGGRAVRAESRSRAGPAQV